jgi:hypothetical protein
MSEKPVQSSSGEFKERVTATIGVMILIMFGAVAVAAAFAAMSNDALGDNFNHLKDLLTLLSGFVGTVIGYYFGRVGVEKRAETAESTMQLAQTAWSEAERQAAQAVAKLDVEGLAREAAVKAKELAEQAQEQAEVKVEEMSGVMVEVTQGMHAMRGRVETFKQELADVGEAAAGLGSLVLGAEEEGAGPQRVDTQKLDDMAADIDALLRKVEQVRH